MEGTDWVGIALGLAFGIPMGLLIIVAIGIWSSYWSWGGPGNDKF